MQPTIFQPNIDKYVIHANMIIMDNIREITKPMSRGQITIPIKIRKKLAITNDTWLWVNVNNNNQIVIEPVKPEEGSIHTFLANANNDTTSYWTDTDSELIDQVSQKSLNQIKELND